VSTARRFDPIPSSKAPGREPASGFITTLPLRERLRVETAALHGELERRLALLDPTLSRVRYAKVLRAMYGYYSVLEPRLLALAANTSASGLPSSFALELRTPLLERDLLWLRHDRRALRAIPRCDVLPELEQLEQLAGCVYVIEGAALGGQLIVRELRRRLGVDESHGAAFFAGGSRNVAARWRGVVNWLNALPAHHDNHYLAITSARDTFATLDRWIRLQGASV